MRSVKRFTVKVKYQNQGWNDSNQNKQTKKDGYVHLVPFVTLELMAIPATRWQQDGSKTDASIACEISRNSALQNKMGAKAT